ncbi:MAG: tetratricopeptide repeat protein [Gammaproteobacteria bacterium]|nr:tetratricopeptide repeat protein [Gammaproteobacteria bacterium]
MTKEQQYSNEELGVFFKNALKEQDQKNFNAAEKYYKIILNQLPNHPDSLHYLGIVKHNQGFNNDAIYLIKKAISKNSDDLEMQLNLAIILEDSGHLEAALSTYSVILKKESDHAQAHCGLADIYKKLNNNELFSHHCSEAYKSDPISPKILNSYASLLSQQQHFKKAISTLELALKYDPGNKVILSNLVASLYSIGDFPAANKYNNLYDETDNQFQSGISQKLFFSNYEPDLDLKYIYQRHIERAKLFPQYNIKPHEKMKKVGSKLRVAYVSSDFRFHSVSFFIRPILENHDTSKFEVFCYSNCNKSDDTTNELKKQCNNWRSISSLSDEDVIKLIITDEIDILVDLSGYSAGNRLGVFANRVSPVQITYLGYPNTTGLTTVDYRITDDYADPKGITDDLNSEKLARIDNIFLCFSPGEKCPPVTPPPNTKNNYITFGSFNNIAKVNDAVIELWCQLLNKIPNSKLLIKAKVLSDEDISAFTLSRFKAHGIDKNRILMRYFTNSYSSHMATYNEIDIALDTFPYNGTTTTCEALWMGVPVITLRGNSHISRVSASILHKLGLQNFVATSQEDYISAAYNIANDKQTLTKLRLTMRDIMTKTEFISGSVFTKSLENLYLEMWEKRTIKEDN